MDSSTTHDKAEATGMPFLQAGAGTPIACSEYNGFNLTEYDVVPHESEEVEHTKWFIPIHLDTASEINIWKKYSFSHQMMTQGMFNICPQNTYSKIKAEYNHKVLLLSAGQSFIESIMEAKSYPKFQNPDNLWGVSDNVIFYLAMALRADLEAGLPCGRLYAQSLAMALANRMLDLVYNSSDMRCKQGGLSRIQINRVTEYIETNLHQDLSLNEIADVACLTPFHFSRQFKHSMGLSPHQFVLKKKIEHAKKLLSETDLPIAMVALDLGFQNQSHFTVAFRKMVGLTPKQYRKDDLPVKLPDIYVEQRHG